MAADDVNARSLATWDEGFHLPGTGLWLDARHHVPFAFASDGFGEAHADRIVATPDTVRFLKRRRAHPSFLPSPIRRPFALGEADVTLLPAGTMPGAAQLLVRRHGTTLLYVRRVLPEPVGLGEPLETPAANAVLVDAPGVPAPLACVRRADTLEAIRKWVEAVLERSEIPVLLAEPLATAPLLVARLGTLGCEMRLHSAVYETVRVHAALGLAVERAWPLAARPRAGQLLVLPWGDPRRPAAPEPAAASAAALRLLGRALGPRDASAGLPRLRLALVHDGGAPPPPDLHPDEVFLLSLAAGVPELVAHVQRTAAAEALVSPGTPAAVGQILRDLGTTRVQRLGPPEQLDLTVRG
jgi:hypothetical protein